MWSTQRCVKATGSYQSCPATATFSTKERVCVTGALRQRETRFWRHRPLGLAEPEPHPGGSSQRCPHCAQNGVRPGARVRLTAELPFPQSKARPAAYQAQRRDGRSMDLTTTGIPMDNQLAVPRLTRRKFRKNFRLDVLLFLTLLLLVFFGLSGGAR